MHSNARKSDKWIPWYFVLFFVVLAILNGIFVTIATSTHRGVVTDNAYEKGLAYNQTVTASEQQEKRGWQSSITLIEDTLSFTLHNAQGNAIEDATVTAYVTRATQAGKDFSVVLSYTDKGIYKNHISFPLKGQWDVRIGVEWNGQHHQQSKRIIVQ